MSVGAQHGVEGLDAVAEELDPALVDVVRRARALAAPEVVLGRAVHDLALRREHEQRVEEAVGHDLGPARLALHDDVGLVQARELGEPVALGARDVDEELARGRDVRDVEDLVGEAGQRALGQRDQLDGHVDADDRDRGVDRVLDDVEVALDVTALRDAVDDRREADCHVRRDRGAFAHGRGCYGGGAAACAPRVRARARAQHGRAHEVDAGEREPARRRRSSAHGSRPSSRAPSRGRWRRRRGSRRAPRPRPRRARAARVGVLRWISVVQLTITPARQQPKSSDASSALATVANAYDAMPPAPSASARASERTSPTRPMDLPAPRPPAIAPAPWNAPSTPRNAPRRCRPSCTTANGITSARPDAARAEHHGRQDRAQHRRREEVAEPRDELARAHAAAPGAGDVGRAHERERSGREHERRGVDDRHEPAAREHVEARARDGGRDADARARALEQRRWPAPAARRAASRRPGRCARPRPPAARSRRRARPRR